MANDSVKDDIAKRLDVIVALLALQTMTDKGTNERAAALRATGMDTSLIAKVLRTTAGSVRAADAAFKNKSARRKRNR